MKTTTTFTILLLCISFIFAQSDHSHTYSRSIEFPDIPGFKTLACDFHIHTVFSDGSVWPDIRVMEALRDGLDAISLTEHLEYQPHLDDIPHPDRNRSYEIAMREARDHDLLIIHGAEITRDMPPGHSNAIFIEDANKLMDKDPMKVFEEAKKQGAFVFWNHPNWISQRKDGIATITDMHKELIEKDLLHGIEVVNDLTYSDEALQMALDNDLAVVGTSDIHGLVDWQYGIQKGGHRPVMLVFAEDKSAEGIKEAMFAGRTAAYFKDLIVGKEEFLKPLFESSLKINSAKYRGDTQVLLIELENVSNAKILLDNSSRYSFHAHSDIVEIPAKGTIKLEVKTLEIKEEILLNFEVLNGIIAPNQHPAIELKVDVE
ncbi:MAG: Sb-PDE family phosphodiesterase [Bacteroidia bacterium]|nr:Sb-PDE family phosphodiesterase [Bacteroidia bacterium]